MTGRRRGVSRWRYAFAGAVAALLLLTAYVVGRYAAERAAVARLLEAGALVAFESYAEEREARGNYTLHDTDPRDPILRLLSVFDRWNSPTPFAAPVIHHYGRVTEASLQTNSAADVFVRDLEHFERVTELSLGEAIGDFQAAAILGAVHEGRLTLRVLNCYASVERQATFDAVVSAPVESLLIEKPSIPRPSFEALATNPKVKDLWLVEDEGDGGGPDRNRYPNDCYRLISNTPSLRTLGLFGINLDDEALASIENADQLTTLLVQRCRLPEGAAGRLEAAVPNAKVREFADSQPQTNVR